MHYDEPRSMPSSPPFLNGWGREVEHRLTVSEMRLSDLERRSDKHGREVDWLADHLLVLGRQVADIKQKVESHWWEPMRPHLWKLYLAVGLMAFSAANKLLTGRALDLQKIFEALVGRV